MQEFSVEELQAIKTALTGTKNFFTSVGNDAQAEALGDIIQKLEVYGTEEEDAEVLDEVAKEETCNAYAVVFTVDEVHQCKLMIGVGDEIPDGTSYSHMFKEVMDRACTPADFSCVARNARSVDTKSFVDCGLTNRDEVDVLLTTRPDPSNVDPDEVELEIIDQRVPPARLLPKDKLLIWTLLRSKIGEYTTREREEEIAHHKEVIEKIGPSGSLLNSELQLPPPLRAHEKGEIAR